MELPCCCFAFYKNYKRYSWFIFVSVVFLEDLLPHKITLHYVSLVSFPPQNSVCIFTLLVLLVIRLFCRIGEVGSRLSFLLGNWILSVSIFMTVFASQAGACKVSDSSIYIAQKGRFTVPVVYAFIYFYTNSLISAIYTIWHSKDWIGVVQCKDNRWSFVFLQQAVLIYSLQWKIPRKSRPMMSSCLYFYPLCYVVYFPTWLIYIYIYIDIVTGERELCNILNSDT